MTQYAQVRKDTDQLVQMLGRPDAAGLGPPAPPPYPDDDEFAYHLVTSPVSLAGCLSDTSILLWNGGAVKWLETATLNELKTAKLAELSDAFTQRISVIRAGYPDDEITSWPEQKVEATAFTADPSANVPLLSHMAAARGITVADLAARVLANAAAWATMSGGLIGKRQKYEDAVNAAADAASVASIAWVD